MRQSPVLSTRPGCTDRGGHQESHTAGGGQFGRYDAVCRQPEGERYRDSILVMDAIDWLILVVIVLVVVAVAFVIIRRKRRGGGVIATKDKG